MWFVTTTHVMPAFYTPEGVAVEVDMLKWTHEKITQTGYIKTSEPMVADDMQAIAVLYERGVAGYKTKKQAREFAKSLPVGSWKYCQIG